MEKRIDEMAKDLCHTDTCVTKKIGIPCNHRCKAHIYAARAIDKGYRRASDLEKEIEDLKAISEQYRKQFEEARADVAEEIFAEIEPILLDYQNNFVSGLQLITFIKELKKKYTKTEGGE